MHEKTLYDKTIKLFAALIEEFLRADFGDDEEISKCSYAYDLSSKIERLAKILTMEAQERK